MTAPQLARRSIEGPLDEAHRTWLFQLKEAAACFSNPQKWDPCSKGCPYLSEWGSRGGQTPHWARGSCGPTVITIKPPQGGEEGKRGRHKPKGSKSTHGNKQVYRGRNPTSPNYPLAASAPPGQALLLCQALPPNSLEFTDRWCHSFSPVLPVPNTRRLPLFCLHFSTLS